MTLAELQNRVALMYSERGYTSDLPTLGLGLCEEAGEVAGAINNQNSLFTPKPGRTRHALAHELKDLLQYAAAIANAAGLELEDCFPE